jgi:diguanylate cyclase
VAASLSGNELERPGDHPELDPLTGALTRQTFFLRLIEQTTLANSTALPFSFCLVDADQLKNINHLHGQQAGDEALAQVTHRIRLALAEAMPDTPEIFLARFDGNGFVLLIPDCDLERASGVAEDCRRSIAALELSKGLRITVSVGVSQYRLWESAEDTLTRAEQALHLAKQFGRDRVEVTESPKPTAASAEVIPLQRTA